MRGRTTAVWTMAAALTVAVLPGMAQQNEGPILLPETQPKPAAPSATLLVTCDLTCNWKLDGEARGRIEAGSSAKAKVEPGQHMVAATTVDGLANVQQLAEGEAAEQKVVNLELQPVNILRLEAGQEAGGKDEIINARLILMWDLAWVGEVGRQGEGAG